MVIEISRKKLIKLFNSFARARCNYLIGYSKAMTKITRKPCSMEQDWINHKKKIDQL